MALNTHSSFLYGYTVDDTNQSLDFDEGSGEVQATIPIGSYTFSTLATAIETALNDAAITTVFTVTADRATRKYTIAGDAVFSLLSLTGTRAASGIWGLIGFSVAADKTGLSSYVGDTATGTLYATQFKIQGYTPAAHQKNAASAVVNRAADGSVEVIKFGDESFIDVSFRFITNVSMPSNAPIRNNAAGVSQFLSLLEFMISKSEFEFMPDEGTPATFHRVILEKSPGFSDGTGYVLKEMTAQKLSGFYELGPAQLRVL